MINKSKHVLKAIALLINNNDGGYGVKNGIIKNWDNSATQPSESEINAKIIELEAEWTASEYARFRAMAYDSIGNQLDMIYKDNLNGTTTHKASVESVKAKFPKPK
jgi:hypothetical protein